MRWLTNFYDFRFKWTATAAIGIQRSKPDCYSWGISKMESDILEKWYAIKFCFQLRENVTEMYWILQTAFGAPCMNRASVFSGRRDPRKAWNQWGMVKGVGGVRKSIHLSWLAGGLGLGLRFLCWGFKGVQGDSVEEASTLQIGPVALLPGQCTSRQLHPCHRLFDQDWHQGCSSASL